MSSIEHVGSWVGDEKRAAQRHGRGTVARIAALSCGGALPGRHVLSLDPGSSSRTVAARVGEHEILVIHRVRRRPRQ